MDNLDLIREKFKGDNFAGKLGIVLDEITQDTVKMHVVLDPSLNNFYDRPHGGAMYSLADAAFSVIGNNENNISVAVDCSISYHRSPEPGTTLHVEGKTLSLSRKIGSYLFTLYTEEGGEKQVVATMKSTLYRTGRPIEAQA